MRNRLLGIIDATTYKQEIRDLIINRSMAAIPFAGRYRLIDFTLSNMVNSGVESVAIFPKYQYRSLMDHLGSGKEWDLNRKRDGLFFFPSPHLHDEYDEFGSFRQFSDHLDYFLRSSQEYAVITNSYTVSNIQFEEVLKYHIQMNCDITEVISERKSLQTYIMSRKLLMELIGGYQQSGSKTLQETITNENNSLTICHYEHKGYVSVIDSVESYFKHSLEILQPDIWKQLFLKGHPIYTKVKDEPPTKYLKSSSVKNSIVANGSVIEGHVENSVIFRGVRIGKGTVIKNSIIMQKSQIGEDCVLENVILDKDVKVGDGIELKGTPTQPNVLIKGTIQGALMNS
ncbi:GlgC family sugar phosphate nucleotidyltransferase [Metabacillus arenae]|uniref:Glucose-1-phosphate adenylyltransferase n=1 Tax=Metabacillus arenae TaxID=2771434 RepID=A0A926NHH6_9BACI|nr:sugar phosphate nucleotidyltransferase [Metabacillus arenae]MBD1383564.1 glucose-1-phosphate adenylyltransferase [Metabacillus arenae]